MTEVRTITPDICNQLLTQLVEIINLTKHLKTQSRHHDLSDLDMTEIHKVISMSRAAIDRISGRNSTYTRDVERILSASLWDQYKMLNIVGVVESLRANIESGYLQSVVELVHGELFGDFLEMARYLLDEGYKDPSAVIAGSSLEAHLRQLCLKHGIVTEISTPSGVRSKKADQMNADLTSATILSKLDQKNVTAWLDLRNKAAHGRFSEYTKDQVSLMVAGIQDFITRNAA